MTVDRHAHRGAPEAVRFWAKVEKTRTCWLWTAATQNGYGIFTLSAPSKRSVKAHRWAYENLVGPIPEGMTLDHVKTRGCTSRACVNPAHLEVVTQGENNARTAGHRERKTHCPKGHAYAEHGTMTARGWPNCRACGAENARTYRQNKREVTA